MALKRFQLSVAKRASVLILSAVLIFSGISFGLEDEKISSFGKYHGYSSKKFDSWVRSSRYLTMRDGTKIAIDIVRPAVDGKPVDEPLPVVWTQTRYRRAFKNSQGKVYSTAESFYLHPLLEHGYITAAADVRGSGASFGKWHLFSKEDNQDAYEITEWLAAQPWCDGNVGMYGGSYGGVTQLLTASTQPPHLKAIFPMVAFMDMYGVVYPGGVTLENFLHSWSELTEMLDTQQGVMPVDEDPQGELLKEAMAQHEGSLTLIEIMDGLRFRDDFDPVTQSYPFQKLHPAGYINEISTSGIPMYIWAGWFDIFTFDSFLMYDNFSVPRKLVVGAWPHNPQDEEVFKTEFDLMEVEQLRWFDYWLKGIDNGIMDEPPIRYQVMEDPGKNRWETAQEWPLPQTESVSYYFSSGPSGSVDSVNDGILSKKAPGGSSGGDPYKVDYSTTTGTSTRWDNAVGGKDFAYPDMTVNDEKGLTYTTPVLSTEVEVTGHPVVRLWLSSTQENGNVFVYLEEVDEGGFSHYITEGALRLSHRSLHEPPYDNLGLPYHRSFKEDIQPMHKNKPVELVFDMQPTSNVFDAGHRIRITVTGADKDNYALNRQDPPPTYTIHRSKEYASHIEFPIYQKQNKPEKEEDIPTSLN